MKLCWADRIGVAWAVLVAIFFGAMTALSPGIPDPLYTLGMIVFVAIAPVWLAFRLIDFIMGGPARRRGQFRVSVAR